MSPRCFRAVVALFSCGCYVVALWLLLSRCFYSVVELWLHCCCAVVAPLSRCFFVVDALLTRCCRCCPAFIAVVALMSHCYHAVFALLFRCGRAVVALLLGCCCAFIAVVALLSPCGCTVVTVLSLLLLFCLSVALFSRCFYFVVALWFAFFPFNSCATVFVLFFFRLQSIVE